MLEADRIAQICQRRSIVVRDQVAGDDSLFVKAVKIQLPNEACELGVLEVLGKDNLLKFSCLVDNKAASMWLPRDDITIAFGHSFIEHIVEFHWEWVGMVVFISVSGFVIAWSCGQVALYV